MTRVEVFDPRISDLGEGPLWHPERNELFWFDINKHRLLADGDRSWQFDEYVSAAGWVDKSQLLVASESALTLFDVGTGASQKVCPLDAEDPTTRSNDGRADPYGGFWIGTMPKGDRVPSGRIFRYYRGEVRTLVENITISNSICFSPDGMWAYWTDTGKSPIWKQRLDPKDGWPIGDPIEFADPAPDGWRPDGSVVDADGNLWSAQYGGFRVACYAPDGTFKEEIKLPARAPTCPAFGGPKLDRLFITTATQKMDAETLAQHPDNGRTLVIDGVGPGQAEHRVIL